MSRRSSPACESAMIPTTVAHVRAAFRRRSAVRYHATPASPGVCGKPDNQSAVPSAKSATETKLAAGCAMKRGRRCARKASGMNSKPEIKMEIVSGWLGIERSRLSFRSIVEREMSPTHAVATAACGNFTLAVPVAPLSAVVLFTLMQALLSAACGLTHAARPHTQGVILQVKAIKSYVRDRNVVRKAYHGHSRRDELSWRSA